MTGLSLRNAEATAALGRALATELRIGDVVALSGPLGAGKTTFVRGVLAGLDLRDEAPSPSFALVIAYDPPEVRLPFWHVDLYRIENARELDELGLEDARNDSALAIEWPERMGAKMWPDALHLLFEREGEGRSLTWTAPPSWERRWPPARP